MVLKLEPESAPVKVIEFINLACPYCKKWYFDTKDLLNEYVQEGKVQRVIKLFDKEKPSLKRGNVLHHHLDYKKPEEALMEIDYLLAHQNEWGMLKSHEEIAEYAVEKRGLTHQPNELRSMGSSMKLKKQMSFLFRLSLLETIFLMRIFL